LIRVLALFPDGFQGVKVTLPFAATLAIYRYHFRRSFERNPLERCAEEVSAWMPQENVSGSLAGGFEVCLIAPGRTADGGSCYQYSP
jgi:hypothetical protein